MDENGKTKSILIVIAGVLSMLLLVAGIVAAVIGVQQLTCTHVWDDGEIRIEATCDKEGEIVYHCENCTKTQKESIPKVSHTWKPFDAKTATCTEDGHNAYIVCDVCGAYKDDNELVVELALGHEEERLEGYAATCTKDGLTNGLRCTRCESVLVAQRAIPALGHSIEQVAAKAATCTKDGNTAGQRCKNCGTVYVGCEVVPSFGHIDEDGDDRCDFCRKSIEFVLVSEGEKVAGNTYRVYFNRDNTVAFYIGNIYFYFDGTTDGTYIFAYAPDVGPLYYAEGLRVVYKEGYVDIYFHAGLYDVVYAKSGEKNGDTLIISDKAEIELEFGSDRIYRLQLKE